jgi:hypothetical protein
MEAEYYALTEAAREAVWLRGLLQELSYEKDDLHPTRIFGDNKPSHALADNPEFHQRAKHIRVQYHFIREEVQAKNVRIYYIPTRLMTADGLTKVLGPTNHTQFVELLRMQELDDDWSKSPYEETSIQQENNTIVEENMASDNHVRFSDDIDYHEADNFLKEIDAEL